MAVSLISDSFVTKTGECGRHQALESSGKNPDECLSEFFCSLTVELADCYQTEAFCLRHTSLKTLSPQGSLDYQRAFHQWCVITDMRL